LFAIDLLYLCPAHYWLTVHDNTSNVDGTCHGNVRGTVEAVAAGLGSLTRAEVVHFTCTLVPIALGSIIWALGIGTQRPTNWFLFFANGMFAGMFLR
jgi:hypothetical protein